MIATISRRGFFSAYAAPATAIVAVTAGGAATADALRLSENPEVLRLAEVFTLRAREHAQAKARADKAVAAYLAEAPTPPEGLALTRDDPSWLRGEPLYDPSGRLIQREDGRSSPSFPSAWEVSRHLQTMDRRTRTARQLAAKLKLAEAFEDAQENLMQRTGAHAAVVACHQAEIEILRALGALFDVEATSVLGLRLKAEAFALAMEIDRYGSPMRHAVPLARETVRILGGMS